jgi:hypothetical protein
MTQSPKARFLSEFPKSLHEGNGAIFVGAGVSMAAGYPGWSALLRDIGTQLGVSSKDVHDLAALAQWAIGAHGENRVRDIIRKEILPEKEIPEAVRVIAQLPVKHIWTTNYDLLVERAFREINRPIDPVSSAKGLSQKPLPGATRLYKMHGSVERTDDIVISTDHYELFRKTRRAYLPLFEAHLTSMSMLFIGISFTDPNVRHVLSLIRESFLDEPPEHFAIVKPPQRKEFGSAAEYKARLSQHKLWAADLKRYGLIAVEVDSYQEIPKLLREVEQQVAARRIWVSGSWPLEHGGSHNVDMHALAESVGNKIGETGRDLVTGAGLLVGSASLSGFLAALRDVGEWNMERRLIARPFPQPLAGKPPNRAQWAALRSELARQAGIVIFLGGAKLENNILVEASGVLEEFELAVKAGAFVIPVGASGGAAKGISERLIGSKNSVVKPGLRPTDTELTKLSNPKLMTSPQGREKLMEVIFKIIDRFSPQA